MRFPHEKARAARPPSGQYTQNRKDVRLALDFVDHDETFQVSQREFGVCQSGQVGGVLQIEPLTGDFGSPQDLQSQRCPPDPTGAEDRHDGELAQQTFNSGDMSVA